MKILGGVALIIRRSLRQHAVSTVVTVLSTALAAGLVMAVFSIQRQTYLAFTDVAVGFDAVLGARGSQLQLVLNAVYHLETSPGNLPWSVYQTIRRDSRVEAAIPYALGDNYLGYRIIGTVAELFELAGDDGRPLYTVRAGGRLFDPQRREAVLGSFVAQRTGLDVGSTFQPYHGLVYDPAMKHAEQYVVVGVLEPTNTPNDRVIWIPLEGVYRMGGHVLRGSGEGEYTPQPGEQIPDEHKEVSAVMLKLIDPQAGMSLDQLINKQGKIATLAWPIGRLMAELFDKLGWVNRVLELVSLLTVAVAAASILACIYNTINERRREFAVLRALGARRWTVVSVIIGEAAAVAAMGSLAGYLVYAAVLAAAAAAVRAQTGVVLDMFYLHPALYCTPPGMTLLGALAGLVPAVKAYACDVAEYLTPHN